VDVNNRDRKDQLSPDHSEPTTEAARHARLSLAEHVVALIDRLEQGVEVGAGPRLACGGDEDQRLSRAGQPARKRIAQVTLNVDNAALGGTTGP
jgi:hypothetical protein